MAWLALVCTQSTSCILVMTHLEQVIVEQRWHVGRAPLGNAAYTVAGGTGWAMCCEQSSMAWMKQQ